MVRHTRCLGKDPKSGREVPGYCEYGGSVFDSGSEGMGLLCGLTEGPGLVVI